MLCADDALFILNGPQFHSNGQLKSSPVSHAFVQAKTSPADVVRSELARLGRRGVLKQKTSRSVLVAARILKRAPTSSKEALLWVL